MAQTNLAVDMLQIKWSRLIAYLRPYGIDMLFAIAAVIIATGLGLLAPLAIVRLLASARAAHGTSGLNRWGIYLLSILAAQSAFAFLQSYLVGRIGEHIICDVRVRLFNQLQCLSLEFFVVRRVGELISRLTNDVMQMRTLLTDALVSVVAQSISLIGALIVALTLNYRLTLMTLIAVPVIAIISLRWGGRIQALSAEVQDQLALSTVAAEEVLQGIRVVKTFNMEEYEAQRFAKVSRMSRGMSVRLLIWRSLFTALILFLSFASLSGIVWFGAREVVAGRFSLPMITGFAIYFIVIATRIEGLSGVYSQVRISIGGVQRIFEILDLKSTVQDTPEASAISSVHGEVIFEDVYFGYEKETSVIRGISLEIRAGETLALVGPSGAGKSTLFNLIPRFYDLTSGAIRIDGRDVRSFTQASLRSHIGMVHQDTILFGGSIRDNLLYGRIDARESEMFEAARAANAHEFIMKLPAKYDTLVGERGSKLSGGQRQRIAIARALLKNPSILLLDEPTSALDSESENLVQEAVHRLMKGRTTIVISHRWSTIRTAPRIAVLDQGRIVEVGSHDELLKLNRLYQRFVGM